MSLIREKIFAVQVRKGGDKKNRVWGIPKNYHSCVCAYTYTNSLNDIQLYHDNLSWRRSRCATRGSAY